MIFLVPVELPLAGLRRGFEEHGGTCRAEAEAEDAAGAAAVRLVDGIVREPFEGAGVPFGAGVLFGGGSWWWDRVGNVSFMV